MYVSIRDAILAELSKSMEQEKDLISSLKFLNLKAVEMEFSNDGSVYLLSGRGKHDKVNLFKPSERDLLGEQLDKNEVKISAFLMHNDFSNPSKDEEVDRILKCIEAVRPLGVKVIRLDPAMPKKGLPVKEAAENAIRILEKVLSKLPRDESVFLGMENHGEYSNNPEFLRIVLSTLNDPRIGITLDSGNFYWYGLPLSKVYELFSEFAPYAKHTHIKNIKYPVELRERQREMGYEYARYVSPIYEGDIDHRKLVESLRKAGYEEDLCIEDESLGKFSPKDWPKILKKDAEFLKELLGENS